MVDVSARKATGGFNERGRIGPVAEIPVGDGLALRYDGREFAYRYLLLLRFGLVNIAGLALLSAAYLQGWVETAIAADPTRLTLVIIGVFVAGFAICAAKIFRTSRELNLAKEFDPFRPRPSMALRYLAQVRGRPGESRALAASALRHKLSSRVSVVRFAANTLVLLGLIGTVIGFIMALSGRPSSSSPISSRNRVPPLACSMSPRRLLLAPVKVPASCPKSSDSRSSRGRGRN